MKRALAMMLFLSGCSMPVGMITGDCTASHGGDPYACWKALALDKPRPATGKVFHSASTMQLASATCVRSDSEWWFHGAHNPYTKAISAPGNAELNRAYSRRYPALTQYLDEHGSLRTTSWTKMRGSDLSKFGVPQCNAVKQ